MARKTYKQPMARNWFMSNTFYKKYMVREATSLFIGLWFLNLLYGHVQLWAGKEAWEHWLALQASPGMMLFSFVAFLMACYHTWTWFNIAPRAMPAAIGHIRLNPGLIGKLHWIGFIVVSVCVLYVLL